MNGVVNSSRISALGCYISTAKIARRDSTRRQRDAFHI